MTPPQLFLIKEQIIIPFGFPFALFGNWKKVILTEATVLIFWLYLIRQTVCPKKIHFRGESWQVCLKRADIRTIFSLPIINKKNILLFFCSPNLYLKNQVIKSYSWIFDYNFTKIRIWTPLPKPFSAWMIHVRYVSILCAGFKSKKVTTNLMIFKKKFLGKWLEIPISHLFTVIIQKI